MPKPWYALVGLLAACSQAAPKPDLAPRVNPAGLFTEAVTAIAQGDIDTLIALRAEPRDEKMRRFLRDLYDKYGPVARVTPVAFEQEDGVARGVFVAEHKNGPFVWDMIHDGRAYPLLRGSNDLAPYLVSAPPPAEVMGMANAAVASLNRGEAGPVFDEIVCNCLTRSAFEAQVATLVTLGGAERARSFVRGETLPGLQEKLYLVHFLSRRSEILLGFHFTFWNVNGDWKINAVNWTQEELLPQPRRLDISQR